MEPMPATAATHLPSPLGGSLTAATLSSATN